MQDDSNQSEQPTSIEQDKLVAWREHQFRQAKMSMRGLQATDYGSGGGEFIEPVQSGQPIPQLYPDEQMLLAMGTGSQIVSGTPGLADSYNVQSAPPESSASSVQESASPSFDFGQGTDVQTETASAPSGQGTDVQAETASAPSGQPAPIDPGLQDFDVPLPTSSAPLETIEPTPSLTPTDIPAATETIETPGLDEPSLATVEPPPEPVAPIDEMSLWPPGSGQKATEDMIAAQRELESAASMDKPSAQRPDAPAPPVFMDRGAPGMPDIDWGGMGAEFSHPTADQRGQGDGMQVVVDGVGFAGNEMIETLLTIARMLLGFGREIEKIRERLDSDDQADQW